MEKKTVQIEVTKEMAEVYEGLAKIVSAAKQAAKDGFQAGQDMPVILVAAVAELPGMLAGIDKLDDEAKAAMPEFVATQLVGGALIAKAMLS